MRAFGFDTADAFVHENGFYLTTGPERLGKLLAHYELYKRITGLPGAVVECGVFKGASLMRFATFRNLLEAEHSRAIVGFDAFGRFPRHGDSEDGAFIDSFEQQAGDGISVEALQAFLAHKRIGNVNLVAGDILETVPRWCTDHPAAKVALLHVDVDVEPPTVTILEHLAPRVVPGGLIVFDDYGTVAGETRAADAFLSRTGLRVEKLPMSHIPAFVVV
jgi:hypothetical protein